MSLRHARVVVIGGGIVGCSALWHLARKGWKDLLLLERDELTAGSTWHAAGNCPNFSSSWALLHLQRYSTGLYRALAALTGSAINYHVTGSLRLAQGAVRMDEYRHVAGLANQLGLGFELLPPEELKRRYPPLNTAGLAGGLWDPGDGDIDPSQATQAFAAGARTLGATILRQCPVTAMRRQDDGWRLTTPQGEVQAEIVVNAAGYRAGEVAALVGQRLPIVSLQHQYLVTEDLPELAGADKLPLLRDPDDSYYLRQERAGLLLGPYEKERAVAVWEEGIPPDFVAALFPDDLDRLEPYIARAVERVPLLGQGGVKRVVNGPIPYTPDGNPLIGPAFQPGLDLRGLWLCCAFSFGIVQGGGAGKAIADWIVEGEPEWDLWALDPRRFTGHSDAAYTRAKALEVYQNEYAAAAPHREWPAARPVKTTALTPRLAALGAVFGARNGWERALWFKPPGFAGDPEAPTFRRPVWFDAVAAECRAVREAAGLAEIPGFSRFLVEGPGAAAHLDRLLATRLPPAGQVRLAYGLTPRGGVLVETTVVRLGAESFRLASAAAAEWHDWQWLLRDLPDGVTVRETTAALDTLALSGPRAREVLEQAAGQSLADLPWRHRRDLRLAGVPVELLRFGYSGELGYELHLDPAEAPVVHAALLAAGARPVGMHALDSLRLEKGYPAWKSELEIKVSALASGLERFLDWRKPFDGREALLAERAHGPRLMLALLALEPGDAEALPLAAVWRLGRRVGQVTSGGYGHWVGRSLALAYLEPGEAQVGTRVEVEVLGERRPALVVPRPLHDPENRRMKG